MKKCEECYKQKETISEILRFFQQELYRYAQDDPRRKAMVRFTEQIKNLQETNK